MATSKEGGKLMQEIYDQFLICKICYEAYKRPKTLACLHIFCTECLEKHMDAEMERSYRYLLYSRMITCPICRKKTEIPSGGIKRLPDNFLVTNLTQIMSRRRPSSKNPACGICQQSTNYTFKEAVSKCLDCSKFLCSACVDLHLRTKVTKIHSLIDVEDEKDIECKAHTDEVVRFYCEPCEMCICVLCTFQEHKGHEVSSFTEGLAKYRHSLDGLVTACRERVAALRERLDRITNCKTVIHQAEEQIRDTAINSIAAIRKKEKQMIQDLMNAFGEESLEFVKEKEPIQDAIENLVSTCNLTDIILKDKGIELLLLKKEIQEKLQLLLNYELMPTPNNLDKCVKFLPGKMVFGYLSVDSNPSTQLAGDEIPATMYSSVTGCDVIMQTDDMTVEDRCTSIGGLFPYCDHDIFSACTQTEACEEMPCGRCLAHSLVESKECQTMTDSIEVVKRKVQTEAVQMRSRSFDDDPIYTTDRSTNTNCVGMCTRSTTTRKELTYDRPTDTTDLITSHHKLCGTRPIVQSNHYTLTDVVPFINKSTLTETPATADKLTGTSRQVQKDESSNTPVVICLDMGVSAKLEGIDKAINTKTIVTMDSSTGNHNAHVQSCGTATHDEGLQLADVATWYDAVAYSSRASSPVRHQTCDQSSNTSTVQLLSQQTMCNMPASGTDVPCQVTPICNTCECQTDISYDRDIIVADGHRVLQETTTQIEVADVGVMVKPPTIERRDSFTECAYIALTTTGSDAQAPRLCESSSNTESFDTELVDVCVGPDDVMRSECEVQTDLTSSLHPIDYVPLKSLQDGSTSMHSNINIIDMFTSTVPTSVADCSTTMFSNCEVKETETATSQVKLIDRGCMGPSVSTNCIPTNTPIIAQSDGQSQVELDYRDKSFNTCVDVRNIMTNTPAVSKQSRETNTAHYETSEQFTNTRNIQLDEKGTSTPHIMTLSQNTGTELVHTREQGMVTYVANIDKATYMPQPVIITTGTNTPIMQQADKRTNTAQVETRDWASMTHLTKRMVDHCSNTPTVSTTIKGTNTIKVSSTDRAVEVFRGDFTDAWTLAKPLLRDKTTEMRRVVVRDSGCNPVAHGGVESGTCMGGSAEVCDAFTSTITPATRDVAILKRPQTVSQGVETKRTRTTDNFTAMPTITTQDTACNTPGIVDIDKFNVINTEKPTFMERAMQTIKTVHQERSSSPVRVSFGEDKAVGVRADMYERGSSPITLIQTQDKCTGHNIMYSQRAASPMRMLFGVNKGVGICPEQTERAVSPVYMSSGLDKGISAMQLMCDSGTSMQVVSMTSTCTNTTKTAMVARGCSPSRTVMVDQGTNVPKTQMAHCATSTITVHLASTGCGDDILFEMVDRGSTPVRVATHEEASMATVETAVGQTETELVDVSDGSTSTTAVELCDSSTSMPHVDHLQKYTSTPTVSMLHKNVYTDHIQTVHAYTSTDHSPQPPSNITTTTRGTSTYVIDLVDRDTSPPPPTLLVEKATSPVRVIRLDKGISVNRAELVAPVESFQRAGAISKLITPGQECNEPLFIPRLTAIREDSKESSSDEEGVARSRMLAELSQSSIVRMEQMWSTSANGKRTAGTNTSTFTAHGSCQTSTILCRVETGTSTPPIETEDKAISTESFVGNGKMAECISKLRSVTQRLETQSTLSSMSQAAPPIYSKANITGHQSVSAPSSLSTSSTVSGSTSGGAITTVTTVHAGSKSVGDTSNEGFPSPFDSPITGRKFDSLSESESPSLRRKARKQRLDMSQLLRSTSSHEEDDSPFSMSRPHLKTIFPQVIPNIAEVIRKSPRPPRRRKSDSVRQRSSDEQSLYSESSPSSHSSHSSPERLKEKLQKMPSTFESIARRPGEKHSGRSRSDKHRDKLQRQASVAEAGRSKPKSRDLTPPAPVPQLALMRRPRKPPPLKLRESPATDSSRKLKGFAEEEEDEESSSDSSKGGGKETKL